MGAQMSLIAPNLYLGSWQGANNAKLMEENGVRHVLTIFDARYPMPECVRQRNHLHLVAADSCQQDIRQFFSQANDFIHAARVSGEAAFVHCMAGVSRSATLIVVYLASVTDLPWDTVLKAVRAAKHDVAPNFHFRAQMRLWQTDGGLQAERERLVKKFGPSPFQSSDQTRLLQLAEVCDEFERTGYWRGEPTLVRRGNAYFAVHHLPDGEETDSNGNTGGLGGENGYPAAADDDDDDDADDEPEIAEEALEVAADTEPRRPAPLATADDEAEPSEATALAPAPADGEKANARWTEAGAVTLRHQQLAFSQAPAGSTELDG